MTTNILIILVCGGTYFFTNHLFLKPSFKFICKKESPASTSKKIAEAGLFFCIKKRKMVKN